MKIIKINRLVGSEEIIKVYFEHNQQKAFFTYVLIGKNIGIETCSYVEKKEEDIYSRIHAWIEKHIETETKVLMDGQEVYF